MVMDTTSPRDGLRIAHISDLHIDERRRIGSNMQALAAVIAAWRELKPDLILVTGDCFERKSSPVERLHLADFLKDAAYIGVPEGREPTPVIVLKGNHDADNDLGIYTKLGTDADHPVPIHVIAQPLGIIPDSSLHLDGPGWCAAILALPWMDKAGYQSAADAAVNTSDAKAHTEVAKQGVLQLMKLEAQQLRKQGIIPIMVGHLNVLGASVASGQVPQGSTLDFTPEELAEVGCAYVALGHIHKQQSWFDGRVCYAGSPARHDFGEPEEKGWCLVELSLEGPFTNTFMPLPGPAMHRLELDLTNEDISALPECLDSLTIPLPMDGELPQVIKLPGSIVRLRYLVSEQQPVAAFTDIITEWLLQQDVLEAQVEPVIQHDEKVRCSAIAKCKTIWQKVVAWLDLAKHDEEIFPALSEKLHQIEGDTLNADGPGNGQPIFLDTLRFRGITCFPDEVKVDFNAAGPGLIALVGPNGAGKTTVMEAVLAGLYRTMASRPGSLYDHCHGTDAFIETVWQTNNGADTISSVLRINAEQRRLDQVVDDSDGPWQGASSARDCKEAIAQYFGTREQVMSSVFMSQDKGGSFLTMPRANRRQLFIEMLGLGKLQELHESAKAHKLGVDQDIIAGSTEQDSLEPQVERLKKWESELPDLKTEQDEAVQWLQVRVTEHQQADAALHDLRQTEKALAELVGKQRLASEKHQGISERLSAALSEHQQATESWQERVNTIDPAVFDKDMETARHAAELALETMEETAQMDAAMVGRSEELEQAKVQSGDLMLIQTDCHERQVRAQGLETELRLVLKQIDEQDKQGDMAGDAPCAVSESWDQPSDPLADSVDLRGTCPLLKAAGSMGETHVARKNAIREELDMMVKVCGSTTHEDPLLILEYAQLFKEKAEELASKRLKLLPLVQQCEDLPAARERLAKLEESSQRISNTLQETLERCNSLRSQSEEDKQATMTRRDTDLRAREQAIDHIRSQKAGALHALRALDAELDSNAAALPAQIEKTEQALADAMAAMDTAKTNKASSSSALTLCQQMIGELLPARDALNECQAHLKELGGHRAQWHVLAKALSKTGVQALELEAASPEVSGLVNRLLDVCYGSRFSVTIQTLRETQSGEQAEDFGLVVYDQGQPRPVDYLSGGEKVIIQEAVSLALAIFNGRKSGVKWGSLFRDETASALDPENASHYVAMLRKALELGGFHQVIFVAHLPQVYESADVRLLVGGGQVTVQ